MSCAAEAFKKPGGRVRRGEGGSRRTICRCPLREGLYDLICRLQPAFCERRQAALGLARGKGKLQPGTNRSCMLSGTLDRAEERAWREPEGGRSTMCLKENALGSLGPRCPQGYLRADCAEVRGQSGRRFPLSPLRPEARNTHGHVRRNATLRASFSLRPGDGRLAHGQPGHGSGFGGLRIAPGK